ncbi:hypothetical protein [Ekhidna sp.]
MLKLLELHFAQLEKAWSKSKFNVYSDPKKGDYHNLLERLFNKIKVEDFTSLDEEEIRELKVLIDFFFKNLEYLNSTTLNNIPFEIIKSLEIVLRSWVKDSEKYIIVTSLLDQMDFYFDPTLYTVQYYYDVIKERYSIDFENRLIQISLPKLLSNDYLAASVLYHELGHFIDKHFRISETIVLEMDENPKIKERLISEEYIPDFIADENDYLESHLMEYFADIFAATYLGNSCIKYLEFLDIERYNEVSYTHPSTLNRSKIVDSYLQNDKNTLLDLINKYTKLITEQEFIPIINNLSIDSFNHLIPEEIDSEINIHMVYEKIWGLWSGDWNEISEKNNFQFTVDPVFKYEIINNLTEKTISNYIISSNWKDVSNKK